VFREPTLHVTLLSALVENQASGCAIDLRELHLLDGTSVRQSRLRDCEPVSDSGVLRFQGSNR
jgi:hypothetical protein